MHWIATPVQLVANVAEKDYCRSFSFLRFLVSCSFVSQICQIRVGVVVPGPPQSRRGPFQKKQDKCLYHAHFSRMFSAYKSCLRQSTLWDHKDSLRANSWTYYMLFTIYYVHIWVCFYMYFEYDAIQCLCSYLGLNKYSDPVIQNWRETCFAYKQTSYRPPEKSLNFRANFVEKSIFFSHPQI